jgi:hypothetical protein
MIVVVIPIYKEIPSHNELISLQQCIKVLKNYEIYLVKPKSLSATHYLISHRISCINFPDRYFRSINDYNRLLLSTRFYTAFIRSEYLLIYQLDAFVFSDQLSYWANKGLDYVGAPWIDLEWPEKFKASLYHSKWSLVRKIKKLYALDKAKPPYVGNGGLSLRKTRKFIFISLIFKLIKVKLADDLNEDAVWSLFVPKYIPFFNIARPAVAIRFCIETSPMYCYKKNGHHLPFACHAWELYDKEFWKPFIEERGYLVL